MLEAFDEVTLSPAAKKHVYGLVVDGKRPVHLTPDGLRVEGRSKPETTPDGAQQYQFTLALCLSSLNIEISVYGEDIAILKRTGVLRRTSTQKNWPYYYDLVTCLHKSFNQYEPTPSRD